MFKTRCMILMTSAIFLIAINVTAQDLPKGAWWTESSVVKALNLRDNEVEQLEEAFAEWHLNIGMLKSEIRTNQREIDSWMARNSSNPQEKERIIRKLKDKVETARSLLPKAKPTYINKVSTILGPARFEKLLSLKP